MVLESILYVSSVLVTVVQYSCYAAVTLLLIPFLGIYAFDLFLYLYRLVDFSIRMQRYKKKRMVHTGQTTGVRNSVAPEETRRSSVLDANVLGLGKLFIVYDLGVWVARHFMSTVGKVEGSRAKSE